MHTRKVIHVSNNLKSVNSETNVKRKTSPPICTPRKNDDRRDKKVITPLIYGEEEEEKEATDISSASSLRDSVFKLDKKSPKPQETILKILVIGDSTVGKTSYVQAYIRNTFLDTYRNTVGVDFATKVLSHKKYGGRPVKLQIWDIAGQDRNICITRVYYKNSHGCVIMFDLNNRKSFENVVQWKHDLDSKTMIDNDKLIPCLLLASKCDLPNRQVEMNEIEAVCQQYGFMSWIEVSSKECLMVEDSMNFLVDRIICSKRLDRVAVRKSGISLMQESEPKPNSAGEKASNTSCFC